MVSQLGILVYYTMHMLTYALCLCRTILFHEIQKLCYLSGMMTLYMCYINSSGYIYAHILQIYKQTLDMSARSSRKKQKYEKIAIFALIGLQFVLNARYTAVMNVRIVDGTVIHHQPEYCPDIVHTELTITQTLRIDPYPYPLMLDLIHSQAIVPWGILEYPMNFIALRLLDRFPTFCSLLRRFSDVFEYCLLIITPLLPP